MGLLRALMPKLPIPSLFSLYPDTACVRRHRPLYLIIHEMQFRGGRLDPSCLRKAESHIWTCSPMSGRVQESTLYMSLLWERDFVPSMALWVHETDSFSMIQKCERPLCPTSLLYTVKNQGQKELILSCNSINS